MGNSHKQTPYLVDMIYEHSDEDDYNSENLNCISYQMKEGDERDLSPIHQMSDVWQPKRIFERDSYNALRGNQPPECINETYNCTTTDKRSAGASVDKEVESKSLQTYALNDNASVSVSSENHKTKSQKHDLCVHLNFIELRQHFVDDINELINFLDKRDIEDAKHLAYDMKSKISDLSEENCSLSTNNWNSSRYMLNNKSTSTTKGKHFELEKIKMKPPTQPKSVQGCGDGIDIIKKRTRGKSWSPKKVPIKSASVLKENLTQNKNNRFVSRSLTNNISLIHGEDEDASLSHSSNKPMSRKGRLQVSHYKHFGEFFKESRAYPSQSERRHRSPFKEKEDRNKRRKI